MEREKGVCKAEKSNEVCKEKEVVNALIVARTLPKDKPKY